MQQNNDGRLHAVGSNEQTTNKQQLTAASAAATAVVEKKLQAEEIQQPMGRER